MAAVSDALWTESHETVAPTEHLPASIRATLFELIAALQDAAGPDDDAAVVAAVADMLQSGRLRFLDRAMQSWASGRPRPCTGSTVWCASFSVLAIPHGEEDNP
jgi:hypothetical protein